MPTNNTENIYSTEFENDPNPIPSSKIGYDNTESGLEATTVQGAIDELDSKIKASDEASEITYDNTESELEATNVQGAIDEVAQDINDVVDELKDKYVLVNRVSKNNILGNDAGGSNFANAFTSHKLRLAIANAIDEALPDTSYYAKVVHLYVGGSNFTAFLSPRNDLDLWQKGSNIITNNDLNFVGTQYEGTSDSTAKSRISKALIYGADKTASDVALTSVIDSNTTFSTTDCSSETTTREFSLIFDVYKKVTL